YFCSCALFWYSLCYNGGDLWYGSMEPEQNCGLGLGHYQLCMVDRNRSCRNIDFCYLIIIPPGLENRCEPCSRSNDHLCGNLCRPVSDLAHGSCVGCLLYTSLPKYKRSIVGKL